jgi:shikimate 5-dehydrogenase
MRNLKDLINQGYVEIAKLPKDNGISIDDLDKLDGYVVPLISHDYSALTPRMWNGIYKELGLNIRNVMVVASPEKANQILTTLRTDEKYLGGGFGVGWKEQIQYLDEVRPSDLKSVNIVVKEEGRLVGYNTDALGLIKSIEDKFYEIGKKIEGCNYLILGAGGVAKQVSLELAKKRAGKIVILNRNPKKAVSIANEINGNYKDTIATAGGEEIIRGYALNSFSPPDVILNLTDKGSDGELEQYSAFAVADTNDSNGRGFNQTFSRTICHELKNLNPNVVIADIVLPKGGTSITLRHAKNAGLEHLIDGKPMVVNQAAPAYILIQDAHADKHKIRTNEKNALEIFRRIANQQ